MNNQSTQIKYTLGAPIADDPYHVVTVCSPITRNLVARFDVIADEIAESFKMFIPPTEGSSFVWYPVNSSPL